MNRIIVIGGLSAGPSAAAKARRENENVEIILFEKSANISYATCGIPYALSGVIPSREKLLVVEANLLRERFNIDVRLQEEVLDIDPRQKIVVTSNGIYDYDKLVFATGARAIVPPITNIEKADNWSTCRSLADFDKIMKEGVLESVKHITVMGAGLIGVEVAENIRALGKKVTLIEGGQQILPMWQEKFSGFAQDVLESKGIEVLTGNFAKGFDVSGSKINRIEMANGSSLATDFVIMSVGIRPNTEMLIQKGAKSLANGALLVDERMETSLPGIYAAGDNASIRNMQTGEHDYFPLGTHSNKGGRTAGANAAGAHETFKGAYKTAIIKLFDYTMARTGMNARELEKRGIAYRTNLIVSASTPRYYPGQKEIIVELYYSPEDDTIYGAELFGEVGVDKRVDVLSTAIYAKLKMSDLPQLDLAYAPPFSPAKDPVVETGFVTSNIANGQYNEISVEDFYHLVQAQADIQVVDVRSPKEIARSGKVEGAINIELDTLRDNLHKLDKDKETILYCAKGL
ncbi:MAG: FAD-dependent oxidoreductase, partial [Cyclobacteriaceae bacterium]|nr:FAD-dependent oxidoreductase [Cyclobacteriaceae bacterium]